MSTLQPPRRANLPSTIANQLRRQIAAGQLAAGAQLPGHRDLAAIFDVSVGSVREAISMLIGDGLVEARAGRGTFVAGGESRPVGGSPLEPPLDRHEMAELIEAREVVELQLVTMAAERASAEAIGGLKEAIGRMRAAAHDPQAYCEADLVFHQALAAAAGNRFLAEAMTSIRGRLKSDFELSIDAAIRRFGNVLGSIAGHEKVVEAIEVGDSQLARDRMFELIGRNHQFLLSLYGLAAPPAPAGSE